MRRIRRPTLRFALAAATVVLIATTLHARESRTAQLLAELIRIDTSNPPGREGLVADPYPIDADALSRVHGNDERVSIQSLEQGTRMIYETLVKAAGRKGT